MRDIEYANTDATVEQVKAAIRAAKVIMQRPLPLTHASPEIALVGYKEEATGQYKLLKEFRVFQTGALFAAETPLEGHVRLIALPYMTREEYEMVNPEDLPNYRVYETVAADGE
jgi:hypothetical protein